MRGLRPQKENSGMTNIRETFIVQLWIDESAVDEFEHYEQTVAALMAQHGGRIDLAIRRHPEAAADEPFETHILSFPSIADFEAYRSSAHVKALAQTRSRLIQCTTIHRGTVQAIGNVTGK